MQKENDDIIQLVDKAMSEFSVASTLGAHYADIFPVRAFIDSDYHHRPLLMPSQSRVFPLGFQAPGGKEGCWVGGKISRICVMCPSNWL